MRKGLKTFWGECTPEEKVMVAALAVATIARVSLTARAVKELLNS